MNSGAGGAGSTPGGTPNYPQNSGTPATKGSPDSSQVPATPVTAHKNIPVADKKFQDTPPLNQRSTETSPPRSQLNPQPQLQHLDRQAEQTQHQLNRASSLINYRMGQQNLINNFGNINFTPQTPQNLGFSIGYTGQPQPADLSQGLAQQLSIYPQSFGIPALPIIQQQLWFACSQMLDQLNKINQLQAQYAALSQSMPPLLATPTMMPLHNVLQDIQSLSGVGIPPSPIMAYPRNWAGSMGQYLFIPAFQPCFNPEWLLAQCPGYGTMPLPAMTGWYQYSNCYNTMQGSGGMFGSPAEHSGDHKQQKESRTPPPDKPPVNDVKPGEKPGKDHQPTPENHPPEPDTRNRLNAADYPIKEGSAPIAPEIIIGTTAGAGLAADIGVTGAAAYHQLAPSATASLTTEPIETLTDHLTPEQGAQAFYNHLGIQDTHSNPLIDALSDQGSSPPPPETAGALDAMGFDLSNAIDPLTLGIDAGASVVENAFIFGSSQRKFMKVRRRRNNIIKSHQIRESWTSGAADFQPGTPVNRKQFKDLCHLCFLEDELGNQQDSKSSLDKNIKAILKNDDSYVTAGEFKATRDALFNLVEEYETKLAVEKGETIDKAKLKQELESFIPSMQEADFNKKEQVKHFNQIFESLDIGIKISYKKQLGLWGKFKDKIGRQKDVKVFDHKIKINKEKFHAFLAGINKQPPTDAVVEILQNHSENIDALYQLKDYDKWKLYQHKRDASLKAAALAVSPVPLPIDEVLKSVAFGKEAKYRVKNKQRMESRITQTEKALDESGLSEEEKATLTQLLENARDVKNAHIGIKSKSNTANSVIHGTSAALSIPSKLLGPVGVGVKAGVKTAAKVSTAVGASVDRFRKDKALKEQQGGSLTGAKDIYQFYKQLYLQHEKKRDAVAQLANITFGLPPESFETLVKTKLVEDNKFKLSFSQKTK
ncbi:hypothetical protein [Endozoicomonas sp. Mp262]|uniref:hypothetical protein n=1 Tax=Endozoicomonas sp. Mp262 TaxID=2919499 RepID=UPI0021D7EEA2